MHPEIDLNDLKDKDKRAALRERLANKKASLKLELEMIESMISACDFFSPKRAGH